MPVRPEVTVKDSNGEPITVILQTNDLGQDLNTEKEFAFNEGVTPPKRDFILSNVHRDSYTKLTFIGNGTIIFNFRRGELG
jgi:hypothetical protein